MGRADSSTRHDRKVQPPRPPNAWILYRSYQSKLIRQNHERMSQAAVSRLISEMWRNESDDVKRQFEREAEKRKAQHHELYPDYRFCPKRKGTKRSRKKSKCRDDTPSDADQDQDDDDAPPAIPALPPMPFAHQSQILPQSQPLFVPGYHQNTVMPQPFMIPYVPEARYGPGGPSPPMSAAPSPAPNQGSQSSPQPRSLASSSSNTSTRPSSSSESQVSSSSSLPPAEIYTPSLPNSHHPSPNPYATLPLSTHLFQNSTPGQVPLVSPRLQLRSAEDAVTPAASVWNSTSTYLPSSDSQNSEEIVNLDLAVSQTQNYTEFQQNTSGSSFDSLQAVLSRTEENGVFNLSNIQSSELLTHPRGDLEVAMGPQASILDYNDDLFADFDFDEFQRQMDSFAQADSRSAPVTSSCIREDLQSLFYTPNNPELEAYTAAQQRQPSMFTQDMMNFLNFEAMEDSVEVAVSPPSLPTTVAPHQVRLQSPQVAAAMPIFTQMTNTPTVASGTSYVPPAGAIHSSTRRVAGSWKPSFTIPHLQVEEPIPSWSL